MRELKQHCFGITTSPSRLSEVRQQRRANSRYASLEQCRWELRSAEAIYRANRIPVINSAAKSVEEMSTVILQSMSR